jgi:hypothetical protein
MQEHLLQVGELPLPLPQLLLEQGAHFPAGLEMKYDAGSLTLILLPT